MDDLDDILLDEQFFDPYQMTKDQIETIRRIARVVLEQQKVCYTKAVIIAYIEWLSMAEVENQRH